MEGSKTEKVFKDENNQYNFDFSSALRVFEPHKLTKEYSNYLSDVDFVIEEEKSIICMEYKNSNVSNSSHPEVFESNIRLAANEGIGGAGFREKLARKFYGTLFMIWACKKNEEDKPIKYILLFEHKPGIDEAIKKKLIEKMRNQLPFKFNESGEIERAIISDFGVLSLMDWKQQYPEYDIKEIN